MSYLISISGAASVLAFLACVMLANGLFGLLSVVSLCVCLALCLVDASIAVNRGVKKNQEFNWASLHRSVRRPEDDGSYYDV